MPSNFELYRVRGDELNDQFFNIRFRDIDARLTHVESNIIDIESIANSLIEHGLELVNTQLQATLLQINEQLNAAQGLVQQVEAQVEAVEEAIEDILGSGNLPANSITLDPISGLVADNAQDALAELQGDIDNILGDITDLENDISNFAVALNGKAPLTSPTFSGVPTAPTPPSGNNSTRIATTAFVQNVFGGQVPVSRLILGGGLVTGGGDLNQDRTLTVTVASQAEAEAGSINNKAMTPLRTKQAIDAALAAQGGGGGGTGVPVGTVTNFAGANAPSGWLFCYGQNISRTTYAALFSVIGTTYGNGDGSTTFTLPDCRGRVVAGKDNMGGSSANRLTSSLNGDILGNTGGSQSVTLSANQVPRNNQGTGSSGTTGTVTAASHTGTADSSHNNVQPTIIFNTIIYTGVE